MPNSRLSIYKTRDIGLGYTNYMPVNRFRELIALNKIRSDVDVHLTYQHGNVSSYVKSVDIDKQALLTDEVYIVVKEETNEIYMMSIGKISAPNKLYYQEDLEGLKGPIDKIGTFEGIKAIYIDEIRNVDFI